MHVFASMKTCDQFEQGIVKFLLSYEIKIVTD
jgi:hypothetical protein